MSISAVKLFEGLEMLIQDCPVSAGAGAEQNQRAEPETELPHAVIRQKRVIGHNYIKQTTAAAGASV